MNWLPYLLLVICVALFVLERRKNSDQSEQKADEKRDYSQSFKSKWLFSYNEKDIFHKLQPIAQRHGLILLAKVRLYDLVEPRDAKDKSARYKIQSKHVDFVLCKSNLVAKYVIELDDQSHEKAERRERDVFVDEVLTACGYKVLHMRAFDEETLEKFLTE